MFLAAENANSDLPSIGFCDETLTGSKYAHPKTQFLERAPAQVEFVLSFGWVSVSSLAKISMGVSFFANQD